MIDKHSVHQVEFVDMTHDAMGVAKIQGFPVFVKNALKGETAEIRISKVNKNFAIGTLLTILSESPFRKKPICEHYADCGGCNLMHMNYDMQLGFKRHRVKETLKRIGGIKTTVNETVGMNNPYYYRNKAMIPFGVQDGEVVAGFYKPRSHEIVNINRCLIYPKFYSDIIKYMKVLLQRYDVSVFDESTGKGLFRGLMIRHSHSRQEAMVVFVAQNHKVPARHEIVKDLVKRFPMIKSVIVNVAPDAKNFRLGTKSKVIFGEDSIEDTLLGNTYSISHASFFQINPVQTEALYHKAFEYADFSPDDIIIDAYSGIGAIGLAAAPKVEKVIGFDSSKSAIRNAEHNARVNNIFNAEYRLGKAEDVLPGLSDMAVETVFVDPPRKGCDKGFLDALIALNPRRIIYVSCNISTFARDAGVLSAAGYTLEETTPFDMFPQTSHIESVSLLIRQS